VNQRNEGDPEDQLAECASCGDAVPLSELGGGKNLVGPGVSAHQGSRMLLFGRPRHTFGLAWSGGLTRTGQVVNHGSAWR
jgi:hypothetical protein